jgi:hypothetical protein
MLIRCLSLTLCASLLAFAQASYNDCPLEGSARDEAHRLRNRLKNRYNLPDQSQVASSITLEALLSPGNDRTRFRTSQAATIVGYVVRVIPGGLGESCNCGSTSKRYRDTHIELALSVSDSAPERRIIVEVTPRIRAAMLKQGIDWSTDNLAQKIEHQRVRISGWMFFDEDHAEESENTAFRGSNRQKIWRATAWEVHPVTRIEVRDRDRWVAVDQL